MSDERGGVWVWISLGGLLLALAAAGLVYYRQRVAPPALSEPAPPKAFGAQGASRSHDVDRIPDDTPADQSHQTIREVQKKKEAPPPSPLE